jgi:hypothetical protein
MKPSPTLSPDPDRMMPSVPAVLLIAFNRPASTLRVFEAIRRARPSRLFIACDGPRSGKLGEAQKVEEVRAIARKVDWPCEVRTRYLEHNVGCGQGPADAIGWFLSEAGEGVILEDDCVPEPAFFRFAAVMLDRYRDEPRVGLISGSKMAPPVPLGASYGFSRLASCWGWATWGRAWNGYDLRPAHISSSEVWTRHFHPKMVRNLTRAVNGKQGLAAHAWDYQFMLHLLRKDMLTVVPDDNLVLNIGFDGSGTHFTNNRRPWWVPHAAFDVASSWAERPTIAANVNYDRYFQAIAHGGCGKFYRMFLKYGRLLRRYLRPGEA